MFAEQRRTLHNDGLVADNNLLAHNPDRADLAVAFLEHQLDLAGANLHAQALAIQGDVVGQGVPLVRQARVDGVLPVEIAETAEAIGQRRPRATTGGDVHTIGGVVVQVAHVHEQTPVEELLGLLLVAQLRGDDGLHDGRQGGISRGQNVVVVVVRTLDFSGEALTLQEQCQHHVGLLQNLVAVDRQRVVVQQQRALRADLRIVQIPDATMQELVVLGVDLQLLVVRDVHALGSLAPEIHLCLRNVLQVLQVAVFLRAFLFRLAHHRSRDLQVVLGHHVCVQVVVHHGRVLVRAGHRVDLELILLAVEEADGHPEPRGLHQKADALLQQKLRIAGCVDVLHQRKRDVGINVVLRGTRRVVGRGFLAVDGAPRKQGAVV